MLTRGGEVTITRRVGVEELARTFAISWAKGSG
jgi:hypothetical protein